MDTQLTQQKLLGKENYIDIWLRVRKYKINKKENKWKQRMKKEERKRKGMGEGKKAGISHCYIPLLHFTRTRGRHVV